MKTTLLESGHRPAPNETQQLCAQIDSLVRLLDRHGCHVRGYSPASIRYFDSLGRKSREEILRQFQAYTRLCLEAAAAGVPLRESGGLTKGILKKLRLVAPQDFFETLESDDIVEIYDRTGVQIFRNFVFYQHCSYTLLDLISHPWFELLERHESVTKSIGEHIELVLGSRNGTIPSQVKPHYVRELFSDERRMFASRFKAFAPLFSGPGIKSGFVCSGKLTLIPHEESKVKFI